MAVAPSASVPSPASSFAEVNETSAATPATAAVERLTIVHLFEPGEYGGLERVVEGLAVAQQGAGHRVHVMCIRRAGGVDPLADRLRQRDVRVESIVVSARAYLAERRLVGRALRRLAPDIVHTHGLRPDVLHAGVARRLGLTTIATAHGRTGGSMKMAVYEWLQDRAFSRFDAVAVVSRPLLQHLLRAGVDPSRLHFTPNGWMGGAVAPLDRAHARAALGVRGGSAHVGWVGRVSAEKGPDVLVDAMALLREAAVTASVIGDGPLLDAMRERARVARAPIAWQGVLPNASRYFAGFDVFVLSSRTEGTPIALLEAMAAGVPIVAAAVGGVPDVVSEEEAVLVPPGDASALARAVHRVIGEPDLSRARAKRARLRLERDFSMAGWLRRYDDVYERARCRP